MMMPEFMDEWFEGELLRGALSTAGINGLSYGPYASATGSTFYINTYTVMESFITLI